MDRLEHAVRVTVGVLLVIASLAVMLAWRANRFDIVQVLPGAAPMQFNTGLCFFVLGIGLLTQPFQLRWVQFVCAGLVSLIGFITFIEYACGCDLGIDQMFIKTVETLPSVRYPGRMASNTALCFVLSAFCMALFSPTPSQKRVSLISIVAGVIGAVSSIGVFGYWGDLPQTYEWKEFGAMAIHTGILFVFISLYFFLYALTQSIRKLNEIPAWLSVSVAITGLTMSVILWQAVESNERRWIEHSLGKSSLIPLLTFAISAFFSLLLALATYLLRKYQLERNVVKRQTAVLTVLNETLEQEVVERTHQVIAHAAEKEKSEQQLRLITDTLPALVSFIDVKQKYRFVNDAYTKWFNKAGEEILGKPIQDVLGQKAYQAIEPHVRRALNGCKVSFESSIPYADGGTRYVKADYVPDIGSGGEVRGFVALISDISREKKMNEILEKRVEERTRALTASVREKETLLREIHHRVKNNLNIVSSLLDLQAQSLQDPALVGAFREARNRILSMALIHEKLYQSKKVAKIDFAQYVRDLIPSLYHVYGVNEQSLRTTVDVENVHLPLDVAIPCSLIVNELVSNSLKHAFPKMDGGKIHVKMQSSEAEPNQFALIVEDNGVGLPPTFNLDSTRSLGLKLVKMLARQLGGNIAIESNHGARFEIQFGGMPHAA